MKKFLISLTVILSSLTTFAFPMHMFYCTVSSSNPRLAFQFEIEDSAVSSGIGIVTLSKEVVPSNNGRMVPCNSDHKSCRTLVAPKWVPFQKAQASATFVWGQGEYGKPAIRSIDVNMGKSGRLQATTKSNPDYSGKIVSTAFGFNFPRGVAALCNYFYATGVKPGMSGSN